MKTNKSTFIQLAAVLFAAGLATSTGAAATIDWGSGAHTITGSISEVSTAGTIVNAFAFSTADSAVSTTVNGVTFDPWAFPALDFGSYSGQTTTSQGNYSFTENQGFLLGYDNLSYGSGAFSSLSAEYAVLLSSGASSTFYDTLSLTISGLTIGKTYEFQWWANNSSFASSPADGVSPGYSTATAGNIVGLNANDGSNLGSLGQFAIGTFTADALTQQIDFNGSSFYGTDPMINAFQLRDIAEVPEPSTMALATLWGSGVILLFRRRKSQ
jgi:hypothetical protein